MFATDDIQLEDLQNLPPELMALPPEILAQILHGGGLPEHNTPLPKDAFAYQDAKPPGFLDKLKTALPRALQSGIAAAATPNIAFGGPTDIFRAMQAGDKSLEQHDILDYNHKRQMQQDAALVGLRNAQAEGARAKPGLEQQKIDQRSQNIERLKSATKAKIENDKGKLAVAQDANTVKQLQSRINRSLAIVQALDKGIDPESLGLTPEDLVDDVMITPPTQPPASNPAPPINVPMLGGGTKAQPPVDLPETPTDLPDSAATPDFGAAAEPMAPLDQAAPDVAEPMADVQPNPQAFTPAPTGIFPYKGKPKPRFLPMDQLSPAQQAKIGQTNAQTDASRANAEQSRASADLSRARTAAVLPKKTTDDILAGLAAAGIKVTDQEKKYILANGRLPNPTQAGWAGGAGMLTPGALDLLAKTFNTTSTTPSLGMGNQAVAMKAQIINRWAVLYPGSNASVNKADYDSMKSELSNLRRLSGNVLAFESTAEANLDIANKLSAKVDRTGSPIINHWILAAKGRVAGDADTRAFEAAVRTAVNEYAKVVTSNGASGSVTDTARKEYAEILNSADSPQAFNQLVTLLKQEMQNRKMGLDGQISDVQTALEHIGQPKQEPVATPSPQAARPTATGPNGQKVEWDGKAWVPVQAR